jgi:hypothetical protein
MSPLLQWIEDTFRTPRLRTIVRRYVVQVIAPLDDIEVLDGNGERVTPERFIARRTSFIEDVGAISSHLKIRGPNAKPEDIETYKEIMGTAATARKTDVRDLMTAKGLRTPQCEQEQGQFYMYEGNDGGIVYRFVYETTQERNANWFKDQTRRRVMFGIPQTITPQEAEAI